MTSLVIYYRCTGYVESNTLISIIYEFSAKLKKVYIAVGPIYSYTLIENRWFANPWDFLVSDKCPALGNELD